MSNLNKEQILQAIRQYTDPYLGIDLETAGAIKGVAVDGGKVTVDVRVGFPINGYQDTLREVITGAVKGVEGVDEVTLNLSSKIIAHTVQTGTTPLPEVKNIIAVASGKGGVGKSTISVNLALALQQEGATVGLLDADIYGPSQTRMLGCHGRPESKDGKTMEPMMSYGLQSISIGHLVDEETPMIWRGPMVTSALQQLLSDTRWRDLDYLIIDLPPGTGDIQLTLCQNIPVSGALIVTTPQDIALLDARRGLKMFEKVNVPVLGIVENMSTHVCSQCGHEEPIFGEGGGQALAAQYEVDLLGSLPLDISIREGVDNGKPTVVMDADSETTKTFYEIARRVTAKLSLRAKDYATKIPKIVVENN